MSGGPSNSRQGRGGGFADRVADIGTRVKLAASPATPADILCFLSRDEAVTVRAAAALNPSLSHAADLRLAGDADERVRLLLAKKVATALPGLSAAGKAELRDRTLAVLGMLVQDEAVRVRALLSSVIADLPHIPRDVVLALAQDHAVSVSEPILRLSPLLSADDLLGLLGAPPHKATSTAIACRANLPADVADLIASSADREAICALLANRSAAIRETTLDALIARAQHEPAWHLPLVQRPVLPERAARALSEIVATHLLETLAQRSDLPPALIRDIQDRLNQQLLAPQATPGDEALLQAAHRLNDAGGLDETVLLAAIRAGDARRAAALLAVAAGVPLDVVDRAAGLRSAKALVSLVWKAGFSMRAGIPIQALLGQISPAATLTGTRWNGYPIGLEELGWQLDFLGCAPS